MACLNSVSKKSIQTTSGILFVKDPHEFMRKRHNELQLLHIQIQVEAKAQGHEKWEPIGKEMEFSF